jgi:hypothetical protein
MIAAAVVAAGLVSLTELNPAWLVLGGALVGLVVHRLGARP